MKKIFLPAAFVCLLLATGAIFAQDKTANFAGTWQLDLEKSKLDERMRLESGTLTVAQTDKKLTVATDFKRAPRPEGGTMPADGGNRGMRQGGMGAGRGMGMLGNGTLTYSLDGHETIIESETPGGMPPSKTTLKANVEKDGKLKLNSSRSVNTQAGEMSIKTVETWELLDGGNALKIMRETETPRGVQTSEIYFTKKDSTNVLTVGTVESYQGPVQTVQGDYSSAAIQSGTVISAGVINGKALKLAQPEYPPAAKAVRAGGAVSVQVTLDEQGKVISANAISGHPLLKAAAEKAARQCEFAPVRLSGVPVKVTGIITYNFIL